MSWEVHSETGAIVKGDGSVILEMGVITKVDGRVMLETSVTRRQDGYSGDSCHHQRGVEGSRVM